MNHLVNATPVQKPYIIFDLDGTLIDSSASILAGFAHAFNTLKIKPQRALTAEMIGPPLMHTLSTLSGSEDAKLLNALAAEFKAHYDNEGYKQTVVFPGVPEMLDSLAGQGLTLYIATNKRLHPTIKILQHLGWQQSFSKVFALDFYTPALASKKLMITRILADEGIPAASALYIGDRYEDGVAADDNAMEFALVTWGYLDGSMGIIPSHWQKYESPASLAQRLLL